jgi:hypothetical protein
MSDDEPIRKPKPKWLEKHGDNATRFKRSKAHETRIGESLSGRRLPNSGAKSWSPRRYRGAEATETDDGDIETPDFWIEHKATVTGTMSIKKEYCDKVRIGARKNAKDPAVCFTFENRNGTKKEDWMAVPMEVFKRLCRAAGIELGDD